MTAKPDNTPDLSLVHDISVQIEVELGQSELTVEELLKLQRGSVFALTRSLEQPVDICINRRRVALGEIVAIENGIGVRVAEILPVASNAGARR